MFLSGEKILKAVKDNKITISNFKKENIKGASYVFTLGSKVTTLKARKFLDSRVDPEFNVKDIGSSGFLLKPGEFAIFHTKEGVKLNGNYVCILSTRPTMAQMGLDTNQGSIFCEPNTDNQFALEIVNNGPIPIKMYAGIRIAIGVFSKLEK